MFLKYLGLLTGITQNFARKSGIPVDTLQLRFEIQDKLLDDNDMNFAKLFDNKIDEMVLLYGLYLDGARWNFEQKIITDSNKRFDVAPNFLCKTVMVSQTIKAARFASNTKIYFLKTTDLSKNDETEHKEQKVNTFKCPVYRNSNRAGSSNDQSKNYVATIDLNCKETEQFWMLRGICMILQTDD